MRVCISEAHGVRPGPAVTGLRGTGGGGGKGGGKVARRPLSARAGDPVVSRPRTCERWLSRLQTRIRAEPSAPPILLLAFSGEARLTLADSLRVTFKGSDVLFIPLHLAAATRSGICEILQCCIDK